MSENALVQVGTMTPDSTLMNQSKTREAVGRSRAVEELEKNVLVDDSLAQRDNEGETPLI